MARYQEMDHSDMVCDQMVYADRKPHVALVPALHGRLSRAREASGTSPAVRPRIDPSHTSALPEFLNVGIRIPAENMSQNKLSTIGLIHN